MMIPKIFKVVTESANPVETTHCCFPLIFTESNKKFVFIELRLIAEIFFNLFS